MKTLDQETDPSNFAWLEPIIERVKDLQEQTESIREENKKIWAELAEKRAPSALDKLHNENGYGMELLADKTQLSIEDIEDIYSIFVFLERNIGFEQFPKDEISSVDIDIDRLMEKLETVLNAQ